MSFSIEDVKPVSCTINKDDQTITCPPGTDTKTSAVITKRVQNLPNSYFDRREYTCNTVTNNKNQKCYVQLFFANYTFSENNFPLPGQTTKNIIKPIENGSIVKIFFYSGDTESVFKLPNIRFISRNIKYNDYGKPQVEKIRENVYRATVDIKTTDKLYLKTISLQNSFDLLPLIYSYNEEIVHTNTNFMMMPIIANESYIVGIDVENDVFFATWHVRRDETGIFMEIGMKPRKQFKLSYIIVDKKSRNYRDAIEKWHFSFPDIYLKSYGPGTWVDQVFPNNLTDEVFKTFMPKYYWGYYPDDQVKGLYSYRYVEPAIIWRNDLNCDESYDENIRKCAEKSEDCQILVEYGERDINNKLICHPGFDGQNFIQPILFYGKAKDFKLQKLRNAFSKGKYSGVGVDSFGFYDATYHSNPPVDLCPFYSLDENNNHQEFISVMSTYLDIFHNLSSQSPRGFMINARLTVPQITKYIASAGYEIHLKDYGIFAPYFYKRLWTHRFILGSKAMSHLDDSLAYDLQEEYFSFCAMIGCTPSSGRFFNNATKMNIYKNSFDKWRPIYMEMFNDSVFMANGGGKVLTDYDSWGSFCKSNGTCYASFMSMGDNLLLNAEITSKPECYYIPEGSNCNTNGNNVTMQIKNKYRTIIIKYETEKPNDKDNDDKDNDNKDEKDDEGDKTKDDDEKEQDSNKTGAIVGGVIGTIIVIAVIAAVAIFIIKRKKTTRDSSSITLTI